MKNTSQIHRFLLRMSKTDHPKLHVLFSRNGKISLRPGKNHSFFDFLVRTVIGQQLSKEAANSIWNRVMGLCEDEGISLRELCSRDAFILRFCGVSKNKIRTIELLVSSFSEGSLDIRCLARSEYREVSRTVTALHGFGQWSADMVAIFYLGLPDVWPTTDGALNRGMELLCRTGGNGYTEKIAGDFTPYRSYLALHVWKGLDTAYIKRDG